MIVLLQCKPYWEGKQTDVGAFIRICVDDRTLRKICRVTLTINLKYTKT